MVKASEEFDPEEYREAITNLCGCEDCQGEGEIEVAYKGDDDVPLCDRAFKKWCYEGLQQIEPLKQSA